MASSKNIGIYGKKWPLVTCGTFSDMLDSKASSKTQLKRVWPFVAVNGLVSAPKKVKFVIVQKTYCKEKGQRWEKAEEATRTERDPGWLLMTFTMFPYVDLYIVCFFCSSKFLQAPDTLQMGPTAVLGSPVLMPVEVEEVALEKASSWGVVIFCISIHK